ncbi:hypothetical protein C8R46DRAFT_1201706 [Mycena filopes]|nr:hypothetical protein C8R46DRAFT_1201706 [Mycena filopes]
MSTVPPADSTSPSTTDAVSHTPVEGLWFNDGTLVLQAGSAAFRVYAALLAERSLVFRDMLQFPQPDDGDSIEGCPVVQLSHDERDLECFLKALFDLEFFLPYPAKTDFDTICGIIRLSTKYQVDVLRKRGLYSTWYETTSWKLEDLDEWIRVLLFGQELSLDWILPIAFYRVVAGVPPRQIMHGIIVDGGIHLELSATDKLLCLEQSIALRTSASSAILSFLWERPDADCTNYDGCNEVRLDACKTAEQQRLERVPLRLWQTENWEILSFACATCRASMKSAHARALQSFWDGLPQRFGLADWTVLEQIKAAALA